MGATDPVLAQKAFDRARHYARYAGVQPRVARELADRIAGLDLPLGPDVLEIGCGTGFLTAELLDRGVEGRWLITDKAPLMVERCRDHIGDRLGLSYTTLDGEYGAGFLDESYDLICASMAMQWFDDLPTAVARLLVRLKPGGHLVFNTLGGETFREWREAHRAHGFSEGAIPFPSVAGLHASLEPLAPRAFNVQVHVEEHDSARDFLRRLKAIGASTARRGRHPLPPGALRQVMATFDANGPQATYEVVTCHFTREQAA